MEVSSVKTGDGIQVTPIQQNSRSGSPEIAGGTDKPASKDTTPIQDAAQTQETSKKKGEEKKNNTGEAKEAVEAVNKFLEYMTADLHFKYYEKIDQMQIQLVSGEDQRVLREYPSQEFLKMIANIREAIGMFLDKKL